MGAAFTAGSGFAAGSQGVVVGGRGTAISPSFPEPRVLLGDQRPDARIVGNRIVGFSQGIRVGTSRGDARGLSYRVTIADNQLHLRVPTLPGARQGIFVGSVFHLRIDGNTVELRTPAPAGWSSVAVDAVRVFGTFGPLVQVRENSCIGTRNGVVAHALNRARATTD
jgi:hypothetical protein